MISNVKVTSPFLFAGELLGTVVGSDPPDLFAVRIPPNKTVMERYSNNARVAEESGVHTVNRTRLLLRTTPTATLRREDQDERCPRGQARSRPLAVPATGDKAKPAEGQRPWDSRDMLEAWHCRSTESGGSWQTGSSASSGSSIRPGQYIFHSSTNEDE